MKIKFTLFYIFIFTLSFSLFGQNKKEAEAEKEVGYFDIRGSVYIQNSREPLEQVSIEVNNGFYTTTNKDGNFNIRAKIGDELTIRHRDFETIFYTIESGDRINIEVSDGNNSYRKRFGKETLSLRFNRLIDSADIYLKKDAEKSIQFIGDALDKDISSNQSAQAHELLGDVYMYWKQYDLAISAYKISIQNTESSSVVLKLAKAYHGNEEYDISIKTYQNINAEDLSNYQRAEFYEGLGDSFLKIKNYSDAISSYQDGLKVANKHLISPKITDLNSKIAEVYKAQGQLTQARNYFSNSLNLAEKENRSRAVEEQVKVAEFSADVEDYDSEIELRKKAIEGIIDLEKDTVLANESPITLQKQNYKIGNAYYLKNDLKNAIPYLERSFEEADKKEDLVVKKDAARKLSEVNIKAGNNEKGLEYLDTYKAVVDELYDELYAQKEIEISQVNRFRKNILEKQNRITSLESDRALSESKYELTQERNKRQQLIIYSLVGGLILLLVTGYFMFKYIKQQKLANNLLALKSLRSQMNPHFIFNALNSVNSFIATNDERTANKYLTDFSFLMRAVLENSEEDFIPLQKEIELIELYTKLEHFRFQDKFDYTIHIDEKINIDEFKIPPMLLQPYIENAVWHGLRYKEGKGKLDIKLESKSNEEITITVTDDGIGRDRSKGLKTANQKKKNSTGMSNIRKRVKILNEMYKDRVDVAVADYQASEDKGTKVVVTLKKN
ncbi:histidine kinase [Winogradskyella alexanderae]|uniref:Histidine kinase n=1 Tax=Winogradskyella alexanderae TaxID=2877123 RepID=A0ABS7XTR9_9FLAO|nr:histidine kinase [Winogradskyella alexanderae]MCA0133427.1 histidine kinase [Winogradskyella alexanderae]